MNSCVEVDTATMPGYKFGDVRGSRLFESAFNGEKAYSTGTTKSLRDVVVEDQ